MLLKEYSSESGEANVQREQSTEQDVIEKQKQVIEPLCSPEWLR